MEDAISEFEDKLMKKLVNHCFFSDFGIRSLAEAIEWLTESIEKCAQNGWSKNRISDVVRDADRLLSTYETQVGLYFEVIGFEKDAEKTCKKLGQELVDSLADLNKRNANAEKMETIMHAAVNLLTFLEQLSSTQKDNVMHNITIDICDMCKKLNDVNKEGKERSEQISKSISELQEYISKIEQMLEEARSQEDEWLELAKIYAETTGASSKSKHLKREENEWFSMKNLAALFGWETENSEERPNEDGIVHDPELADPYWTTIVTGTIYDLSVFDSTQQDSEMKKWQSFTIGKIKLDVFYRREMGNLNIHIARSAEDDSQKSPFSMTSLLFVTEGFYTKRFFRNKRSYVEPFFSEQKKLYQIHVIPFEILNNPQVGYIKNGVITILMKITLLSYSDTFSPIGLFNPYHGVFKGTVSYTFTDISNLKTDERRESTKVYIGGYNWGLSMTKNGITRFCLRADKSPSWFTTAQFVLTLSEESQPRKLVLENNVMDYKDTENQIINRKFNLEFIQKNFTDFIKNDTIHFDAFITVFQHH